MNELQRTHKIDTLPVGWRWGAVALLALVVACLVSGCGGNNDPDAAPVVTSEAFATLGPAGGTLDGPDGVHVVIPPGALTQPIIIGIARQTSRLALLAVPTLTNVTDFSVGQTSAAAITNGQLWAWGWNGTLPVTTPTRVGTGTGFTALVVGDIHSLAIGPGGEIYSWGDSSYGALGRSGVAATPTVVMRP